MYENKRRAFGRVWFAWPGKHGPGDIRVEFGGKAPSHAEFLTIAYGLFVAEDRYDKPWHDGRKMIFDLLEEIYKAADWSDAKRIVERCRISVEEKRAA